MTQAILHRRIFVEHRPAMFWMETLLVVLTTFLSYVGGISLLTRK